MKTSLLYYLRKPYLLRFNIRDSVRTAAFISLFVFLFIWIFRPFGLSSYQYGIIPLAFGYGASTFLSMILMNVVLARTFPFYFTEENWTVGRELCWSLSNILIIGIANALFSMMAGIGTFSFRQLIFFQLYTAAIGVLPITLLILYRQSKIQTEFHKSAEKMNSGINAPGRKSQAENEQTISLPGLSGGQALTISLNDLIYIESSDNYIEVHYYIGNIETKALLRSTLKAVSEELASYSQILRCHKRFLVNLSRVIHVTGNAQGYKLHLLGSKKLLPVSRSYNHLVKKGLAR